MVYVTIFPGAENIHLIKDVGMIPFILYKYYSYDSKLACYNNGSYDYINNVVKGLKIDIIKKYTGNETIDSCIYLFANAKKIDVLNLYHLSRKSFILMLLYSFLKPDGKVYLKIDAGNEIKNYHFSKAGIKKITSFIKIKLLKRCKLISIETKKLCSYLNNTWPTTVEYIPNGFYDYSMGKYVEFQQKDNIICTVGRIGTKEKATEVLLEGFKLAAEHIPDWKLKIIGPIDHNFEKYIKDFFYNNPNLEDRIVFTGGIYNRQILFSEYNKSKVFCLTSRWESFGIVYVEAAKSGCFILSSDVLPAWDVTDNKKYGDIFPINDSTELSHMLIKYCNDQEYLKEICTKIQDYAYKNYNWINICKKINDFLKK